MDPNEERLKRMENAVFGNGRPGLVEINGRVHEALRALQAGQQEIIESLERNRAAQQADREELSSMIRIQDLRLCAVEQWSRWQRWLAGAAVVSGIGAAVTMVVDAVWKRLF